MCTPCVLYDHLTIVIRHVRCTDYGVRTTVYSSYENDTTPQGRGDHLPAVSSRSTHCCARHSEDRNDAPHAPPIHHTPHHVHRSPDRNYSAAHLSIKPSPKSLGRASYHRNKRTPRVVGTLAAHRAHARPQAAASGARLSGSSSAATRRPPPQAGRSRQSRSPACRPGSRRSPRTVSMTRGEREREQGGRAGRESSEREQWRERE